MSRSIYDNWEKLVSAVVRAEELRELCHASSMSSQASDISFSSPLLDFLPRKFETVSVPEEIYVNNKQLDRWELVTLQSCPNPPGELNHGSYYWYDKITGFWGKKGNKPCQIISANIDVGGRLDTCASDGNTSVYINGREITKAELLMLKMAGIDCHPEIRFWMYEDGSCEEEGMCNVRGNIWRKAGMKLICSLLSLPFPPNSSLASGELSTPYYPEQNDVEKIILCGCSKSETTAIFLQAQLLYKDLPFTKNELKNIKSIMQRNLYGYTRVLLEARQQFEAESLNELWGKESSSEQVLPGCSHANHHICIYSSTNPVLKPLADWLLRILEPESLENSSNSQYYAHQVAGLLKDPAIQDTLQRATEMEMLPTVANHFLQRVVDIFNPIYEPSLMDILNLEDFPFTLSETEFPFTLPYEDETRNKDKLIRYQMINAPRERFEGDHKFLEMFDDVRLVICSLSLTDYDLLVVDEHGAYVNKMILNRKFFEDVASHPGIDQACLLLVLTEYGSFEEKLNHSPLIQCDLFQEFHPVTDGAGRVIGDLGEMAFHYISAQFKIHYASMTGRKLYVIKVNCLTEDSIDRVIKYGREILKWDEEMNEYFLAADHSSSCESVESLYFEEGR